MHAKEAEAIQQLINIGVTYRREIQTQILAPLREVPGSNDWPIIGVLLNEVGDSIELSRHLKTLLPSEPV